MQKYRCYGKDDLGYPYDALSIRDEYGDWYRVEDVDARIAQLEQMVRCSYACCCGDCARKIEKVIPGIERTHGKAPELKAYGEVSNGKGKGEGK